MMSYPSTNNFQYGQPAIYPTGVPQPNVGGQSFPWNNYVAQTNAPVAPIHGPAGTTVNYNGQPYHVPAYVARTPSAGHDQYPVTVLQQLPGFNIDLHNYNIACKLASSRNLPQPQQQWFVNGYIPPGYAPNGHPANNQQPQGYVTGQPVQQTWGQPVIPQNQYQTTQPQQPWLSLIVPAMQELATIINQSAMANPNVVNRQLADMLVNGQNQQPWYRSFVTVLAGSSTKDSLTMGRPLGINKQHVQIVYAGMTADLINQQPNIIQTLPPNVVQGIQASINAYNQLAADTKAWMQSVEQQYRQPQQNTMVNWNQPQQQGYGNFDMFKVDQRPDGLKNNLFTGAGGRYVEPPVGNLVVDTVYDSDSKPVMSKWALMNAVESGDMSFFGGEKQQPETQTQQSTTQSAWQHIANNVSTVTEKPAYAYNPSDFYNTSVPPKPAETGYQTSIEYEPTREEKLNEIEGYGKKSPFPKFGYKKQDPDDYSILEDEFDEPRVFGSDNEVLSEEDNSINTEGITSYEEWLLKQGEIVAFGTPTNVAPIIENEESNVTIEQEVAKPKRNKTILPVFNYRRQLLATRKAKVVVIDREEKMEYKDHILPSSESTDVLLSRAPNLFSSPNSLDSTYADQIIDNLGLMTTTVDDLANAIQEAAEVDLEVDDLIKSAASITVNTPVLVTNDTDFSSDVTLVINKELNSEVDLEDAVIHYTRSPALVYQLETEDVNLVKAIQRAKTASSVVARINEFNEQTGLPVRQTYKLHDEATKLVNEQLKIVYDDWTIDSLTEDYQEVYEEVSANFPDKLDLLNQIWVNAANAVYNVIGKSNYSNYNSEELESIGLTEDLVNLEGISSIVRNESVTLLPVLYTDYPLAVDGYVGYLDKDVFPTIYGLVSELAENNPKKLTRLTFVYKDNTTINIVQSVEDKEFYIVR